ncbi:DNA cytosine methyltransferase [Curtobacterium pusillum]|uniref:DNA cytosine methyltransferase n=1 Tax=Curtobacterium pusillum TaxID=69373 RepID=UPI0038277604
MTDDAAIAPSLLSLFSGPGGLDIGFASAGFRTVLAVDKSDAAVRTHNAYFKSGSAVAADLVELGASGLVDMLSRRLKPGSPLGVIGGPPCQAFSRSNPFADVDDPRNRLPMLYLEIVRELQQIYDVRFLIFENVLGIRDSKHAMTFSGILETLSELQFTARVAEHSALDYGVPQDRRRIIISAFANPDEQLRFAPEKVARGNLTVRAAIEGLPEPAFFSRALRPEAIPFHANHWTMNPRSPKFADPTKRIPNSRSFRQLNWEKPSPTVAYGHREIHVHPSGHRRLSIYEALLLQGFPKDFVFEGTFSEQVEQVSNAVPPPLARALAEAVRSALSADGHALKVRGQ